MIEEQVFLSHIRMVNPEQQALSQGRNDLIQSFCSELLLPAHCGIAGNEKADKLAKRGAKVNSPVTPSDTERRIQCSLLQA